MLRKNVYVVQPYKVGTKERKSLAIIIPAKIAREYDVSTSTILALSINGRDERMTLQKVNVNNEKKMIPAHRSFEASNQQASSGNQ